MIAGGRWTEFTCSVRTGHAMLRRVPFRTCGSKSAFHFPELSFSKVEFFWFFFLVCFCSFPKPVSSNSAPLTDSGTARWPMISSAGLCLMPGTAEFSVVCQGFFSHEIKNWCCQKMIGTICLTMYIFLNFTNCLCSSGHFHIST